MFNQLKAGAALVGATLLLAGCPEDETVPRYYSIDVVNIGGQPLSPVVAATHTGDIALWEEGQHGGPGIAELAERGEVDTLVADFRERAGVTELSYSLVPFPSAGLTVPRFGEQAGTGPDLTDSQRLEIEARPGDRLSLAGGLLGTNDGFWGIDRAALPETGSQTYFAFGYDAGTEENNERETHINDDASRLGPEVIPGDEPDNEAGPDNHEAETAPPNGIRRHDGILGVGDVPASYDFDDVIVRVTVRRIATGGE